MPAKLAGSFCIDKCEIHRHISPTRSVNKTLQLICSSVSFSLYKNTMENQLSFFFLFDMILFFYLIRYHDWYAQKFRQWHIFNWIWREMLTIICRNVILMYCKNITLNIIIKLTLWTLIHGFWYIKKRSIWRNNIVFINRPVA